MLACVSVAGVRLAAGDEWTLQTGVHLDAWSGDDQDGYQVLAASNGYEALILARSDLRPAMILLDLMLPVMDGWQFLNQQQREHEIASIPVVLFSGERELGRRAQELRVAGWLRKPVDLQQLLAVVERAITGKSGPYPLP